MFSSIQFSFINIATNVISRYFYNTVKPIGVQFIVIIIQSNPINYIQNKSDSYIQSQFKNNFLAKETNRLH